VRTSIRTRERAAAVLGDSLALGRGATTAWPELVGGTVAPAVDGALLTRPLPCVAGPSGLDRLGRDVLRAPGLHTVVLALGTNDLVPHRAFGGCPSVPAARAGELVRAMRRVAARARARGLRVVGTTIPPRGLARGREAARRRVNAWLRRTRAFDAVADLDAALRDPADTRRLDPAADSGDGLHVSDEGQRRIAAAVSAAAARPAP
jgi:lysophospholipase L1-like esterase